MSPSHSADIARILASPWQQHRNAGGWRGFALALGFCALLPIGLWLPSLFVDPAAAPHARHAAWVGGGVAVLALLVVGWRILVGNLLRQNQPTLARLVPAHPRRLRRALIVAWALLSLALAAGPGGVLGAPLAWGCATAAVLVWLACAVRWPAWWLPGIVALLVMPAALEWLGRDGMIAALAESWWHLGWLVTVGLAVGGAIALAAVIDGGTSRDAMARRSRSARRRRFGGDTDAGSAACGPGGLLRVSPGLRLYRWWLRRTLARRDGAVMGRVMLGLGPATHWASRAGDSMVTLLFCGVMFSLLALMVSPAQRPSALAVLPFAVLTSLGGIASFQTPARLRRTRREQALLALLPGVPRGAALGRRLAWRLSLFHLATTGVALLLWYGAQSRAESLQPGSVQRAMGPMAVLFAIAMPPMVAWLWRDWARLRESPARDETLPVFSQLALAGLAWGLHDLLGWGYLAIAIGYAIAALAYCAWRWRRMGVEPSPFPVGRLG